MAEYNGLIPMDQHPVKESLPHWMYGSIVDNKKVIDRVMHYGCFTLGYDQPDIVKSVCKTLRNIKPEIADIKDGSDKLRLNSQTFKLQEELYKLTNFHSFYALSGSDANEGAIKLASAYHHVQGNNNKKYILSISPSYHGSTYLTSAVGCDTVMDDPFYTLSKPDNICRIDRSYLTAGLLDNHDWDSVSTIILETCPQSNYIEPFTNEFWFNIARIQHTYDVVVIIDDILMGGGKTGTYVGWKDFPIVPDICTMGKAITGGFFPLSVTLYSQKIKDSLPKDFRWQHGYTYSFSIAGIASALEYLKLLDLKQYKDIMKEAKKILDKYTVTNFGNYFYINVNKEDRLYMIPLNASEEYFKILYDEVNK